MCGYVRWWCRGNALAPCPRADQYLIRDAAMCGRNGGEKRGGQCACNPRQHDGGEATVMEKRKLLGAAAVDVRIALFEAQHGVTSLKGVKAKGEEFGLRGVGVAWEFARDVHGGPAWDEIEDGGGDEFVGQDESGCVEGLVGGESEEGGRAGARAGKEDLRARDGAAGGERRMV